MGLEDQGRIKEVVQSEGPSDMLVILGASEARAAELYAETVVHGDPTFAGPLTGVTLNLPVYYITEEDLKSQIPAKVYEEHVALMEMALPAAEIVASVQKVREGG